MKNAGVAAMMTDGPVRDVTGLIALGMPVWCTGSIASTPYENGPGTAGLPVNIGAQRVETGDMIVADKDGVVVVPFDEIDAVGRAIRTHPHDGSRRRQGSAGRSGDARYLPQDARQRPGEMDRLICRICKIATVRFHFGNNRRQATHFKPQWCLVRLGWPYRRCRHECCCVTVRFGCKDLLHWVAFGCRMAGVSPSFVV